MSGEDGPCRFQIVLSIENEAAAHRTLRLRTFLRKFRPFPEEYYQYLDGSILQEPDWATLYPEEWEKACCETPRVELGKAETNTLIKKRINEIRNAHGDRTVLLGGPPCQSYSLAGRSRNAGNPRYDIDKDIRLSLYKEYALALKLLQPAVAVMENVKGFLSARHNGASVFEKVMETLQNAGEANRYVLYALSPESERYSWKNGLYPENFLVRAEEHGVPQRRHRVFVICIRSDLASKLPEEILPKLEPQKDRVSVNDVIGTMRKLRSRLSRGDDAQSWQVAVGEACKLAERHLPEMTEAQEKEFRKALESAQESASGTPLPWCDEKATRFPDSCPDNLRDWLRDEHLTRLPNNETRGHIHEDITRYLFAAAFAKAFGRSPRTADFPNTLAPNHANWGSGKFADRFRVQLADHPATTITSHISKDGHYFIHPDTRQCRSLTVREAARLQTFPDNYLFLGGRTRQYVQVGNAVPPYLAWQIARQVGKVLEYKDQRNPAVASAA